MSTPKPRHLAAVAVLIAIQACLGTIANAETAVIVPAARVDSKKAPGDLQTAVLAGGCFWGVEGVFEHVRGVRKVLSGYAGGEKSTAEYHAVGTGRTGHAESVKVTFDPQEISYGEILRIFFSVAHDPTQLNRQGPDTGTQYRSAIFYADDAQRDIAKAYIGQLNGSGVFQRAIVTRVDPLEGFYPAESYHQDFIARNPKYPYVVINDLPKIRNLKHEFPDLYREGSQR
ncbi:MAG: peptide-methionine (S)-S-oxide reductase [Lysobacterales bacterium]|nr:MAG: peptide-methionine (S)-S-oxide reductase [Xanthomonadales bacterium]